MQPTTPSDTTALRFAEAELTDRIHWFIKLRWVAVVGVVLGTLFGRYVLMVPIPVAQLFALALAIAGCNLLFTSWEQRATAGRRASISVTQARLMANVQISCDLILLGVLIHFSGGIENPLCFFFAFHMIIASILLAPIMAYAQAGLAVTVLAAVVGLEQLGVIRHVHLGLFGGPDLHRTPGAWLIVLTLGTTLLLIVYMTTSITGRLRERESEAAALSEEVAAKAAQLEKAYDDLLATQKLQTAYMRRTSHELRAPLAAIGATLDVLAEGVVGELQPKQKEMIDRARERVRGLMRLVTDLLTLLKSRAAPPKERFEAVNLEHVVQDVITFLEDRANREQVTVTASLPSALPPIWGDDELIDQIVTNLVANAIKYTPPGGSVHVSAEADNTHVALRVSDTGIGIAQEDIARIFEEFYRTKQGREFAPHGTGLGLAIVKSIAEAHDAEITVDSKLGVGTTFTLRFARADRVRETQNHTQAT